MEEQNKKKTTIYLPLSVLQRMDAWLAEDNCKSRNEFIEKALRFYMGYLSTEDTSEYLSRALVATLHGIMADNANRFRSLIFKLCVEVGMASHTVAAHFSTALRYRVFHSAQTLCSALRLLPDALRSLP